MATVLGSLLVSLGLESAEFDRGLDKSRRNMRKAGQDFDRQADKMYQAGFKIGQGIKAIGTTALAVGFGYLVGQLQEAVHGALEFASSLGETAQQLGVTTDALQEYRYAASQAGLSQQEMDKALEQLTRRIGEAANGTKAQAEAFKVLGVSVKGANGNILNAGDAIPKIADALQKIENPAQRAALLTDLFGKAGQKLEPLLSGGSAAVNELRDAAHKLGIVLSESQIQKADETADKLAALNTVLKARIAGAVADNADAILALANAFATLVGWIGKAVNAFTRFKYQQGLFEARLDQKTPWFNGAQKDRARMAEGEFAKRLNVMTGQEGGGLKSARTILGGRLNLGAPAPAAAFDMGGGGGSKKAKGGGGRSGPSAAEIAARFADERAGIMERYNSTMASMASSAAEEAEYQLRNVELQRIRSIAGIQADKDYSAAQKATLIAQQENLAEIEREQVERDKNRRMEQEAQQAAQQEFDTQREGLQLQAAMADTDADRQRIALDLLDLDERERRNALERIISSTTRTDAEKALAQQALDALNANSAANRAATMRQNETRAQAYVRDLHKTPAQINEAIDQIKIDGLEALNDGLVDALVNFRSLGDVAQSVLRQILSDLLRLQIQQSITRPLAGMLGLGGGGGGFLGGLFGGGGGFDSLGGAGQGLDAIMAIPGFAKGTRFAPGGLAIVGEQGPELVNLRRGSQVIPNNELAGMGSSTVHSPTFVFPGITNEKQAREGAGQAARRYRRELNPMRGM